MAKIKIERETMELVARRKALAAEEAKMTDYRTMMLTKLEQASARVRALEKQVLLAEGRLRRVRDLGDKGWVTRSKVDLAKKDHAIIKGQLVIGHGRTPRKAGTVEKHRRRPLVQGDKLDSRLVELRANVDLGWDRVMLAKDELLALQRHKDTADPLRARRRQIGALVQIERLQRQVRGTHRALRTIGSPNNRSLF